MGAIADKTRLNLATAKEFLHVNESDTSQDNVIQLLLDAAVNDADLFCNNPFTDKPIPAAVDLWILQRVARTFSVRPAGIKSENINSLGTIQYDPADFSGLAQYRCNPGL